MSLLLALALTTAMQDNLVVLVVDQLSHWATDPAQRSPLDLPNLDALSSQGTTFSRAYTTSPVCSENRLALLTGRYPFSLGTNKLESGVATLGTLLDAAGWDTGYIGKWHLSPGGGGPSQYVDPSDRPGWRYFAGAEGAPHNYLTGVSYKQNDPTPISTAPWSPSWVTTEALRFLRAERAKPFCLVVNYDPPHPAAGVGYTPPQAIYNSSEITVRPNVSPGDAGKARNRYAKYMSLAVTMDNELGVLLSEVNFATTFVVFTSDHGDLLYSHGASSGEQKRQPWDEATHVPLVMAGPGLAAGQVDVGLMSTVDVLPSVLSLLGVDAPDEVQGSVFPYTTAVYLGHDATNKSWQGQRWRGLVVNNLKYAVTEDGLVEQLFDVLGDPFELTNLATNPAYGPTMAGLRSDIAARASAVGDPFFSGR